MNLLKKYNRHNSEMLPVFKVNFEGVILYANNAALPLLHELGVAAHSKIAKKIIEEHDEIFKMHIDSGILISTETQELKFDAVSFNEAGYIGFYANEINQLNNNNKTI